MKRQQIAFLLLSILLTVVAGQKSIAQEKRLLTIEDRERMRYVNMPAISPDGERVVFHEDGTIWLVAGDSEDPVALTSGSASTWQPRWSADGQDLFFLADRGGSVQIWKLPMDAPGEAAQISSAERGISSLNLSPDESRVALALSENDLAKPREEGQPAPPFVVTRRQFKRDSGGGYITAADTTHLYIYDIAEDSLEQVTSGRFDESSPAWSPDGQRLVFVSNREDEPDASYRTDIWIVDVASGEISRLTNDEGAKFAPTFSPDGEWVAYLDGDEGIYGVPKLTLVPAVGGEPRILGDSLDRWIHGYEFSNNGRWIYFHFDDAGSTLLARIRLSDGRIERLIDDDVAVAGFSLSDGAELAVVLAARNELGEVYRLDNRHLSKLTDVNRPYFDELLSGEKSKVSFEVSNGTIVETFITKPPDFDPEQTYPAILNIHGGPVAQFDWRYSFAAQYWAANGYVVIEPNPRGSTGFGEDFIRAVEATWGITEYEDVIGAVDYGIETGLVDPDRLAVTGFSYGGYMTNILITETNRFKAAASGAGHSHLEANFGHDIYQQWYLWEFGAPWESRENYELLSPFLRVENVETPTMFLGGRLDWNVPILNSELMYQALQVRGIDSELIVYPGVHHGGWPEEYEQDYLVRIHNWFDKYLQ